MKVMSLRLDNELSDRIDAYAEERKLSRNTAIRDLCLRALGEESDPDTMVEPQAYRPASPGVLVAPVAPTTCPHPREGRKQFAWGTICGQCGKKVQHP